MFDYRIVNYLGHINAIKNAAQVLRSDSFDGLELDEAEKALIDMASQEYSAVLSESERDCKESFCLPIACCAQNGSKAEIALNADKSILLSILIGDLDSNTIAESLVQSLLTELALHDGERIDIFRCASPRIGGMPLKTFNKVIMYDSALYGGKVFTDETEFNRVLMSVDQQLNSNISITNGISVFEYNKCGNSKLPITTIVIFDLNSFSDLVIKKIKLLSERAEAGLNIIVVDSSEETINKLDLKYNIEIKEKRIHFKTAFNIFPAECPDFSLDESRLDELLKPKVISSLFEDNFKPEIVPFQLYSEKGIEIPFAVNEEGINVFRIGGKYSPHAIMSGRTGSGKSVTLHTIIDMTTLYYRPDDVEIWAIDYKAVEFGYYANLKTPHIKVIGQDSSVEFSISLIDLAYREYNRRKKLFDQNGVKDIEQYREKCGKYSMTRILVVIDEFHNLVQAVSNYSDITYKTKLENLLKETRAMGISFLFCSQTVSTGLNGLTESGKNQIGIRLCMRQDSTEEIRETLKLKISDSDIVDAAKNFEKGYAFYNNGEGVGNITKLRVIYISDDTRKKIIDSVNSACSGQFSNDDDIICKNSDRYPISDKKNHYLNKLINKKAELSESTDEVCVFPAAPTSLENEFCLSLSRNSSNNILVSGTDDSMRESVVIMSILSALSNRAVKVFVNIIDENNAKSRSLIEKLKTIDNQRISFNIGVEKVIAHIAKHEKIKPLSGCSNFNVWYNLNKLNSELSVLDTDDSEDNENQDILVSEPSFSVGNIDALIANIENCISNVENKKVNNVKRKAQNRYEFESYSNTLKRFFSLGPDYGYFNLVVYNTPKNFSKDPFLKVADFEYRIGTTMTIDDSYIMFGTESFIKNANDTTAVCYVGSKRPVLIRPYIIPEYDWINKLNSELKG